MTDNLIPKISPSRFSGKISKIALHITERIKQKFRDYLVN